MTDQLTALDATFLELEQLDASATMAIGGAMVFDALPRGGAPSSEQVAETLASRLRSLPRYSQRLSAARATRLAWPSWEPDDRFDIRDHIRSAALPSPGTIGQLCDFTAELFSHPLDRTRPLWELVVVEGLEHGRWALVQKTHHCLVDGVGSVDIVELMLDTEPDPDGALPAASPTARAVPRPYHRPHWIDVVDQAAHAGARAAEAGVRAALHPRTALDQSRALAELVITDELIGAPRTSLNVPIGQGRRFAAVRIPLAEAKQIKGELGGSVNDVVLAACATGLRKLLLFRGEELPRHGLRAMVPVNLRAESGHGALGNQVSSLFVDLPVATDDPRKRLQRIIEATRRLKHSGAAGGATMLTDLAALVPPVVLHAALARTAFANRLFNLTITNVPGPQRPLFAFGAQLREVHPVVPLAADHSVGIAVFSYNGTLVFGVNADLESTPDIGVLAYGIEEGIEELLASLAEPPVSSKFY